MNNVKHVQFFDRYKKVKNKKDNYNIIHERDTPGCTVYSNFTRSKALDFMDSIMKKAMALLMQVAV